MLFLKCIKNQLKLLLVESLVFINARNILATSSFKNCYPEIEYIFFFLIIFNWIHIFDQFIKNWRGQIHLLLLYNFSFLHFFDLCVIILHQSCEQKQAVISFSIKKYIFRANISMNQVVLSKVIVHIYHLVKHFNKYWMIKWCIFLI